MEQPQSDNTKATERMLALVEVVAWRVQSAGDALQERLEAIPLGDKPKRHLLLQRFANGLSRELVCARIPSIF